MRAKKKITVRCKETCWSEKVKRSEKKKFHIRNKSPLGKTINYVIIKVTERRDENI